MLDIPMKEPLPPCAGTYDGRLVILGSGRGVWDDLGSDHQKYMYHVMAVNNAGIYYPYPIQHWATHHVEVMYAMAMLRERRLDNGNYYPHVGYRVHGPKDADNVLYGLGITRWKFEDDRGGSALYAAKVALLLGYDEIVLCGCPADDSGHFFRPPWMKSDYPLIEVLEAWERLKPIADGRITSMSGNTRDLFGAPEWVN